MHAMGGVGAGPMMPGFGGGMMFGKGLGAGFGASPMQSMQPMQPMQPLQASQQAHVGNGASGDGGQGASMGGDG